MYEQQKKLVILKLAMNEMKWNKIKLLHFNFLKIEEKLLFSIVKWVNKMIKYIS